VNVQDRSSKTGVSSGQEKERVEQVMDMRKTSRAMRARLNRPAGTRKWGDDWEAAATALTHARTAAWHLRYHPETSSSPATSAPSIARPQR
jgi:hypothetical protein